MPSEFDPVHNLHLDASGRIPKGDADRQLRTACEIIRRLTQQPGLILADEVGMGKTFVALAVAASVHFSDPRRRPAVIMVPPSLGDKWPRDAEVFKECCLADPWKSAFRFPPAALRRGTDVLKALDDPPERRNAVVFVAHGAFATAMNDPWIRLAIVRRAVRGRHGNESVRSRASRHADTILRKKGLKLDEEDWFELLDHDPAEWGDVIRSRGHDAARIFGDDDPVPKQLWKALQHRTLSRGLRELYDTMDDRLPHRNSKHTGAYISDLRHTMACHVDNLWAQLKGKVRLKLPLLIFDEAHHLKNRETKLRRSLFAGCGDDVGEGLRGVFQGVFEKMLFLTATPFQLGHRELVSVLQTFDAVSWKCAPSAHAQNKFSKQVDELHDALNSAQSAALRLDEVWKILGDLDRRIGGHVYEPGESWWAALCERPIEATPPAQSAKTAADETDATMRAVEKLLRPWVIRHLRPRFFDRCGSSVMRRRELPGTGEHSESPGLPVSEPAMLPFLLAARMAALCPGSRAHFSEGLASSYEAFLHTREGRNAALDSDCDLDESKGSETSTARAAHYLKELASAVTESRSNDLAQHPKLTSTADRVAALWEQGEKVVVFCFYIKTGMALRQAIGLRIQQRIIKLAQVKLGVTTTAAVKELKKLGKSAFAKDSPLRRRLDERVGSLVHEHGQTLSLGERSEVIDIVRRFVRTPSFLVRYFPLRRPIEAAEVDEAFDSAGDSRRSLCDCVAQFVKFISSRVPQEREDYLKALMSFETGARTKRQHGLAGEASYSPTEQFIPNVRLVNGATDRDTRRTLMLTFNTPFLPEVLIASAVMAEGVDLHLHCRTVLHHDLSWNPSTLEQRTGRVDRLGALVETSGRSIHIFMPYVAGTQDEKMFRVVMDRERWFRVIMGEEIKQDLTSVEALASRFPLPQSLARKLAFNLAICADASEP